MIHGKHLELSDLCVNMKIRVRSMQDEEGHVMIVHQINGTEITCVLRRHPYNEPAKFTFYAKGVMFSDGTGRALLVERFKREVGE